LFQQLLNSIKNNAPKEEVDACVEKIRNSKPKIVSLEVPIA
jgi:hypothetical protein